MAGIEIYPSLAVAMGTRSPAFVSRRRNQTRRVSRVRRNWVFELARKAANPVGRTQITVEGRVLQLAQRGYALKGVSEH